jgi:hypothetical protein
MGDGTDGQLQPMQRWPAETILVLVICAGAAGYWLCQAQLIQLPSDYNPFVYYRMLRQIEHSPWAGILDDTWQAAREAKVSLSWYGGAMASCGAALMWGGPPLAIKVGKGFHMLMTTMGPHAGHGFAHNQCRMQQQQRVMQGVGQMLHAAKPKARSMILDNSTAAVMDSEGMQLVQMES